MKLNEVFASRTYGDPKSPKWPSKHRIGIRSNYYMSLFIVGRGEEKIKDVGVFPSPDDAAEAAREDFIGEVEPEDMPDYQGAVNDMGLISFTNSKGETIWDIGTDETAYVVMMDRYPELEDLS